MKLNKTSLKDIQQWENAGYILPTYNVEQICKNTEKRPHWIHFGAGNIFRAFMAVAQQKMLDQGFSDTGIVVCEGYDREIIEKIYRPHDNLSVAVTMKLDGSMNKMVVASITDSLLLQPEMPDWQKLKEIFQNSSLQMATFTITEKGYQIKNASGYLPKVQADMNAGPAMAQSYMGCLTALCYIRYQAGKLPLALVSMDNFSHNGNKLKSAVCEIAKAWEEKGLAEKGFYDYLQDETKISFPWSMIDKITPRPDKDVEIALEKSGLEEMEILTTSANTYIAPFVNAEETEYLVIEDQFPNGRPKLEHAGILFADRETVERVEQMKVCTCLNPLHTGLAIFGCLLSYISISKEMSDPLLQGLAVQIGKEGMPVVVDPKILKPEDFLHEVLYTRLPNPHIPDTPQRIATDTSQKILIRYGETIKAYQKSGRSLQELTAIPLVLAGWIRYLTGVDDMGNSMEISHDPRLEELKTKISEVQTNTEGVVSLMLKDASIFGQDLSQTELSNAVSRYLKEMLAGPGAVRKTLEQYIEI